MRLLLVIALLCVASEAKAQYGAGLFARHLDRTGQFHHDTSYKGSEVIFWSSGRANRFQAIQAWKNSPGHAALLPRIRSIRCVGGVCVGRGR